MLQSVAAASKLKLRVLRTDGSQPVGRGIGPALEAHDVLAVLRGEPGAPEDLKARALALAAALLELGGKDSPEQARSRAQQLLDSGAAWQKFQGICAAQGGLREPGTAALREPIAAHQAGAVAAIDCRRLARAAKLAGAPTSPAAGLELHVKLGDRVDRGQALFTMHADAPGELEYALQYVAAHPAVYLSDELSA
jgi:thymidine phosphorylase